MVNLPWQPDYPILTDRLALRPHRAGDLGDLLRYHSDPEVVRYIPWPERTREQTETALESRIHQGEVTEEGQWLVLAIQLRDDVGLPEGGRVIGEVLLKFDSETDARGELGYAIARDAGGRGLATEAARALLDLGFTRFGLHRIVARLDARNRASAALLERLGMRREALFIEDELFKGEWTDTLVYAMLAAEHRPAHIPEAG